MHRTRQDRHRRDKKSIAQQSALREPKPAPVHPMNRRLPGHKVEEVLWTLIQGLSTECYSALASDSPEDYFSLPLPRRETSEEKNVFRQEWLARRLLKKCERVRVPKGTLQLSPEATALAGETKAWISCKETNDRLRSAANDAALSSLLFSVQRAMGRLVGGNLPEIRHAGFGPGRSDTAFGREKTLVHKYAAGPTCTRPALSHVLQIMEDSPLWQAAVLQKQATVLPPKPVKVEEVEGNVMLLVPKDETTRRVICYEPSSNMVAQRIYGQWFKRRLLDKAGIDIDHAQTVHRRLAGLAARYGKLATIDLKSASSHISVLLAMEVLPIDLFDCLDRVRSQKTLWVDNLEYLENEGFCTMGNGFTFEFQTMLYYGVAQSILDDDPNVCGPCSSTARVFGDDIIIADCDAPEMVRRLEALGFKVNPAKTFVGSDPFRESCGYDSLLGYDVTAAYIRRWPKCVRELIPVHNRLVEWVMRSPFGDDVAHVNLAISQIQALIGTGIPRGPLGFGDGHLCDPNWVDGARKVLGRETWDFFSYRFTSFVPAKGHWGQAQLTGLRKAGYHPTYGYAALCAALGPKPSEDLEQSMVNDHSEWRLAKMAG